jgi:hypothetical protein
MSRHNYYPNGSRVFLKDDPYRIGTSRPAGWEGYYYVEWDDSPGADNLEPYNGADLILAGRIGGEDNHAAE